jgi:hypothetical protein
MSIISVIYNNNDLKATSASIYALMSSQDWDCIDLLLQRNMISWEDNNTLYEFLNKNALQYKQLTTLSELIRRICTASYTLRNSVRTLRQTFAHSVDFVADVATQN